MAKASASANNICLMQSPFYGAGAWTPTARAAAAYSDFRRFSAPEISALPGASSMFSVLTTPSSTTIA